MHPSHSCLLALDYFGSSTAPTFYMMDKHPFFDGGSIGVKEMCVKGKALQNKVFRDDFMDQRDLDLGNGKYRLMF